MRQLSEMPAALSERFQLCRGTRSCRSTISGSARAAKLSCILEPVCAGALTRPRRAPRPVGSVRAIGVYIAPAPVPQSWPRPGQPGSRVLLVSFLPSPEPPPRLLRAGRVIRACDFPSLLDEGLQQITIEQDYHSWLQITSGIESRRKAMKGDMISVVG